jgi:hypothetical protein
LAAQAAKEYFFETPILLILRSKVNKIGVSKIYCCQRRWNTFYTTSGPAGDFYTTPFYSSLHAAVKKYSLPCERARNIFLFLAVW